MIAEKKLLLILLICLGIFGICHFVDASVARNRNRRSLWDHDGFNNNTDVRFIILVDACAELLASRKETIRLYHYIHANFNEGLDLGYTIPTYLAFDQFTYVYEPETCDEYYGIECDEEERDRFNTTLNEYLDGVVEEAHETVATAVVDSYINFAMFGNDLSEGETRTYTELLAAINWCETCAPVALPDTRESLEIAMESLELYYTKMRAYDCASPYLAAVRRVTLALPPKDTTEEDWFWERAYEFDLKVLEKCPTTPFKP